MKKMEKTKEKKNCIEKLTSKPGGKQMIIGWAIIIAAAGLLIHRALFGIATPDESFYLTIPYRFLKGDAFFINEWHVAQLSGALQCLPVLFFVKVFGSGEGIILFFRLLYVFCHTVVSCFVFQKISRYGFLPALLSALMFELYAPESLVFPNYYTMSLVPLTVIVLMLFFAEKPSAVRDIFCGFLFACAVLAEPLLSLLYFAYFAAVIIALIAKKKTNAFLLPKRFLQITAGVLAAAVPFFVLLLSRASLQKTLAAIGNIFRSGEYSSQTMFLYGSLVAALYHYGSVVFVASLVCIAAILVDRNRSRRKLLWLSLSVAIAVFLTVMFTVPAFKGDMLPLLHIPYAAAFLGICAYVLTDNKDKKLLAVWLTGFLYLILIGLNSEALEYIGSYGFVLSNVVFLPIILNLIKEIAPAASESKEESSEKAGRRKRLAAGVSLALVCVVAVISLAASAFILSVGDPGAYVMGRGELTEVVVLDRGGLKGIRVREDQKAVYGAVLDDIALIEASSSGKYTVMSDDSWYLYSSDRAPLTFTLWYLNWMNDTYMQYYDYVGENPSYIYIINRSFFIGPAGTEMDVSDAFDYFTTHFNCSVTQGKAGYILKVES